MNESRWPGFAWDSTASKWMASSFIRQWSVLSMMPAPFLRIPGVLIQLAPLTDGRDPHSISRKIAGTRCKGRAKDIYSSGNSLSRSSFLWKWNSQDNRFFSEFKSYFKQSSSQICMQGFLPTVASVARRLEGDPWGFELGEPSPGSFSNYEALI